MKGTVRVAAAGTDESAPDAEAPADERAGGAGEASPSQGSGGALPKTGGEEARLAALGLLLLGLGAVTRIHSARR